MSQLSFILSHGAQVEALYQTYLTDPSQVDPSWRHFFDGMAFAQHSSTLHPGPDLRIGQMIERYRKWGHLRADTNPIRRPKEDVRLLDLDELGFTQEELERSFSTNGLLPEKTAPLKVLIEALEKTYCNKVGIECSEGTSQEVQTWIYKEIESGFPSPFTLEEKQKIFYRLLQAELFESFLHVKFVGQKRFSLEGCETLLPMLEGLFDEGAALGVEEGVLGMAHRGRLNVLANLLGKSYAHLFHEFEDHYQPYEFEGTGDVKYHKGFEGKFLSSSGKKLLLTLVPNPSHLEAVDPVAEGIARAKMEKKGMQAIVPLLIHGDASIAGQGIVYETFQLSGLEGYKTGGTIHLILNNQVGFTASPKETRSTRYCSQIGKGFGVPTFHVNAEDPIGCVKVAKLAIKIRQRFGCDVIIELNGYRKYGHNESDEPLFTHPLEYGIIRKKRSIREIFEERLISEGGFSSVALKKMEEGFKQDLQNALDHIQTTKIPPPPPAPLPGPPLSQIPTAVSQDKLVALTQNLSKIPKGFSLNPKLHRLWQDRLAMVEKGGKIDWGLGEHLCFASLLTENIHVRLSGQDVCRGTFSHRHAVFVDQRVGTRYTPLSHLGFPQAPFAVYNSPLSEYGVLGFDFGYSVAYPHSLVIWEAQFGDFANGAQIVIDQYLSSSEQKWNLTSNLTLLLPHSYEGQGPEHSSGRMERFLQLCGQLNLRVANCSSPAQLFHLLRGQALAVEKKPLVVFTPKGLLRHPGCVSTLEEFSQGHFEEVIDDPTPPSSCKRLLFCTGKIFYDLVEERKKRGAIEIAICRIEQLYPFPRSQVAALCEKYREGELFWVQEEHQNMGAWELVRQECEGLFEKKISYLGRIRGASPAAGSYFVHKAQSQQLMEAVFQ